MVLCRLELSRKLQALTLARSRYVDAYGSGRDRLRGKPRIWCAGNHLLGQRRDLGAASGQEQRFDQARIHHGVQAAKVGAVHPRCF
jgi:hypothetical protein